MLIFEKLLKYKIHIGHSVKNTILLTTWFLHKLRKFVWIINIFKTILFLKIVLRFLRFVINNSFPVWFANLEVTREALFRNYANYCGEFYCTKSWIRGFLSNFKSIQDSMNRFILKKYIVNAPAKAYFANYWFITRYTWPRGIFLSNIKSNYIIAKEAGRLNLPMIAVVDTNVKNFLFNFPIPANSDGKESLCYIISLITRQILLIKYKKLLTWFTLFKLRKHKYFTKFTDIYENLRKASFLDLLNKKKGSFISLNNFKKLRESMQLLKSTYKANNEVRVYTPITQIHSKYLSIKKALIFSYFFKTIMFKLNFKTSKAYRKNIKNLMKYSKLSIWTFRKKHRKYKQRVLRNFFPLHFSFILYNFKFSKIFYESSRKGPLVDASIVIPLKHWMTYKHRANRARYSNKPMTNYWLAPFFKKFFIKINKWQFFHSRYYFQEAYDFLHYMRWYKYYVTKFTLAFYNKWFFFFFVKFKKKNFK